MDRVYAARVQFAVSMPKQYAVLTGVDPGGFQMRKSKPRRVVDLRYNPYADEQEAIAAIRRYWAKYAHEPDTLRVHRSTMATLRIEAADRGVTGRSLSLMGVKVTL